MTAHVREYSQPVQGFSAVPRPALATLSRGRFWRHGWIYERKLDGQRCLAVRDVDGVRLYSRSGRELTPAFPEIVEALAEQESNWFVVDGEIVAFEGSRSSFARLRPRIHLHDAESARSSGIPVWFYIFDVLEIGGEDLRAQPLLVRKSQLRALLEWRKPLRSMPHRVQADEDWFAEICSRGWEGVVAKRADAPYATGRTGHWLKFRCETS